jgi:hypothetical protein
MKGEIMNQYVYDLLLDLHNMDIRLFIGIVFALLCVGLLGLIINRMNKRILKVEKFISDLKVIETDNEDLIEELENEYKSFSLGNEVTEGDIGHDIWWQGRE